MINISTNLRSIFHTAIQAGNTIYTPSAQITYGTWTGLYYININFAKGEAGYIIGEGLNGGFSVCAIPGVGATCNWTQVLYNLLITSSQTNGITATITTNPTTVVVGQPLSILIHYIKGSNTWTENLTYYPTQVGQIKIKPQYDPTASATVTVTPSSILIGDKYNQYDALIVKYEDKFGVPRGVLKSIINKETFTSPFQPNQYKYEPGSDYVDFSSGNSSKITSHPFKQFAIGGHDNTGRTIQGGNELNNLVPSYTDIVKGKPNGWAYRGLKGYTGKETFAQLKALDTSPGSQNWPNTPSNNFTAQTILSASYGLGHTMYVSAITIAKNSIEELWFDTSTSGNARSVYDMNDPETAIHLAASVLRYKYEIVTAISSDTGKCGGWGHAVRGYNSIYALTYRDDVCGRFYDKLYKPK
jgi:hypothetical protein